MPSALPLGGSWVLSFFREENTMPEPIVLENRFLRITLDAATGAVLGLANRATETEYLVSRREARPPFVVDVYSANQAVLRLGTIQARIDLPSDGSHRVCPVPPPGRLGADPGMRHYATASRK
jgi:hypothetical protein